MHRRRVAAVQRQHTAQGRKRRGAVLRAEPDPLKIDEEQHRDPVEELCRLRFQLLREAAQLLEHDQQEIAARPDQEMQIEAVPETRQQPDGKQIQDEPRLCDTRAAHRDVDIIAEPRAERHVPAAPEFRNRCRHVGVIEILRAVVAEHLRQPDRNIRIAAEIIVKLERIADRAEPCQRRAAAGEHRIPPHDREIVCEQHLLADAGHEAHQSGGEPRKGDVRTVCKMLRAAQRSAGDLRKAQQIKQHLVDARLLVFSAVDIRLQRNRLEHEIRNAERHRVPRTEQPRCSDAEHDQQLRIQCGRTDPQVFPSFSMQPRLYHGCRKVQHRQRAQHGKIQR